MSRYRPLEPERSLYITRQGYEALQREFKNLWVRRRGVVRALSEAAAEGDRSENAEYIYRKKELRELDRRIRYLQKRLPDLKVVDEAPADQTRIFFGARVLLENGAGEEICCRIVGPDEFDPEQGWISMDSPLARALLKCAVGDEVRVRLPSGEASFLVLEVSY